MVRCNSSWSFEELGDESKIIERTRISLYCHYIRKQNLVEWYFYVYHQETLKMAGINSVAQNLKDDIDDDIDDDDDDDDD